MSDGLRAGHSSRHVKVARLALALAAATLVAGCSGLSLGEVSGLQPVPDKPVASAASSSKTELEKATEYWGRQYAEKPSDRTAALSYAKNLKAMGRKREALAVLQQSHAQNTDNREHLSEYGRLALELGQVSTAKPLLERADDPVNPDWRVLSARGTVFAKEGNYKEAIGMLERARALAPDQASVLNNLALVHAMNGEAARAEALLRQAASADGSDARVRRNLALVLDAQGKHGEAKTMANAADLPQDTMTGGAPVRTAYPAQGAKPGSVSDAAPASGQTALPVATASIRPGESTASQSSSGQSEVGAWTTGTTASPR